MDEVATKQSLPRRNYLWAIVRYSAWIVATFAVALLIVGLGVQLLGQLGVKFSGVSETTINVAIGAIMYLVMLAVAIGVPWLVWRQRTSLRTLGLHQVLGWKEIGLALAGVIVYFILTIVLSLIAMNLLTGVDMTQEQDLGGIEPRSTVEMLVVFGLLVVVGPVVEEVIFRGYLYGKIRQSGAPFWLTTLVVSLLFGAVHLQWNVAIDTFALSVVMCLTREATGTLWPSILMHMAKNGIAFYVLFGATGMAALLGV